MLALLNFPIALARMAFYALWGLVESLRGQRRMRAEKKVLISAPRDVVWRFLMSEHVVFDGPPVMEIVTEPLPEDPDLRLCRISINGQAWGCMVTRFTSDEAAGTIVSQTVDHELTAPPELATDGESWSSVAATPEGTVLTMCTEQTARSFADRINFRTGTDWQIAQIKQAIEKRAGVKNRLTEVLNHGLLLSFIALLSFWYLFGWQDALLLAAVVVLHEAGHALAMRMVGVEVQGIYLVPFFGGAAVPKSSYRSEFALGFVALMGPGFSLVPTLGLAAAFWATEDPGLVKPILMFALINAVNLLPVYPLDGGLILNALLGSVDRRLALVAGWIGVAVGLGAAVFFRSWLIGIPFLLFALQRYLTRGRTLELRPLSFIGAAALVLGFAVTFALYVFAFTYADAVFADES